MKHELRQPAAARRTQPSKPVKIADRVEIGLSVLTPEERDKVKRTICSWNRLQALSKKADLIGSSGTLRIADVSSNLSAVFRITSQEAEVVDLVNRRAFKRAESGN